MIQKEVNFIISSDAINGAINKTPDGSTFDVQLEQPLTIPKEALNVTVEVQSAAVWWTVPNIITGVNDIFRITEGTGPPTVLDVTVPQGLYDLVGLAAAIERELVNNGASQTNIISFSGDTATQKVVITANVADIVIDFTGSQTFRDILGFTSTDILSNAAVFPLNFLASNVAQFNVLEYFLLTSDLVDAGLRFNNRWNNIVARIYIDVAPGSQIIYTPFYAARSTANKLRGRKVHTMHFTLTDQNNKVVNTAGESYSARIVIRYLIDQKFLK